MATAQAGPAETDYVDDRLNALESRVASLEADRQRLMNALQAAVKMTLSNPMMKMAIPKNVREDLENYLKSVDGSCAAQKTPNS